jgi:LysR family hydrogen peroxide-inducible transcriptional activator
VNLRDLDYVVALADTGHFGEAAQRCHVSQPTLSAQIRKFEEELGVVVFERGTRRTVPTVAGQSIIAQARTVLGEVAKLRELAQATTEPLAGSLRLGVIPTSAPYLLPHLLPALKRRWPKLRLHLKEAMTARLLEQLHRSELDAVILSPPFDERGLATAEIGEEPFMIALPPEHRLAAQHELQPEQLAGETVLMLEAGHCLLEQSSALSKALDLRPHDEVQASSVESLRQMVSIGLGCAIIPAFAGRGPFAAGAPIALRPLSDQGASRRLALAWRRGWPRPDAMRDLAETLRLAVATI